MDKRLSKRFDVNADVLSRAGHETSRVTLRDLSPAGCRLSGIEQQIPIGSELQLTLISGLDISGTVRWAKGGDVGMEFSEQLSDAAVKYFTFDDLGAEDEFVTLDTFGRRLPPLKASNLPEPANR